MSNMVALMFLWLNLFCLALPSHWLIHIINAFAVTLFIDILIKEHIHEERDDDE